MTHIFLKKNQRMGFALFLLVLCLGFFRNAWAIDAPAAGETPMPFQPYTDVLLGTNVTLEHPQEWTVQKERGQSEIYEQIRLLGPKNTAGTFRALISVRVYPLAKEGGRFANVEEFIANYANHLPKGAKIETNRRLITENTASVLTASYTIPPVYQQGLKGLAIPVQSKVCVFQRESHLVEISFSTDAEEFEEQQAIFEHVLASLRLE